MDTNTLKSYKLTHDEWYTLAAVAAGNYATACDDPGGLALDVLILAGLVSRDNENPVLTVDGYNAAVEIDMIFDWEEFAFTEGAESPSDALAEAATVELPAKPATRPEPLSVGSLVRHIPTGGVGLITKHTMYDANWGGFYVDFVKPVDNIINGRAVNKLSHMFDRGDKFERI